MSATVDRARVVFQGSVQGVGFRYTVLRLAGKSGGVAGRVRNLSDGTVEMVAEGVKAEVEGLIATILDRMAGYVRDHSVQWSSGPPQYDSFDIAY